MRKRTYIFIRLDDLRKKAEKEIRAQKMKMELEQGYVVSRSHFDSVLTLIDDHLAGSFLRKTAESMAVSICRAREVIRQARTQPDSPQMGSTAPTRRSKRSA